MFVKKNRKTFLKSHLCQWCFNLNKCFNNLNLLTVVKINGQTISYIYDATGVKLQKKVTSGTTITTDYAEGRAYRKQPVAVFSEGASWRWGIYVSNHLQLFNPPEGYVEPINASNYALLFRHTFQYKDHLGNIRLSYKDLNQNTGAISLSIVEEHNYYPFGLKHNGYNGGTNGQRHHKYMFGGKELQDEIVGSNSFEVYDFGARNYDAALGRWMNLDPLAEKYPNMSPYTYAANNPIMFIDPDGREIVLPKGTSTKDVYTVHGNLQKLTNDKLVYSTQKDGTIRIKVASLAKAGSETKVAGTNLIRELNSSDKTVTIVIGTASSGNSARPDSRDASGNTDWTNSKNGTGDNVTVNFDPTSNPSIKAVDPKTGDVAGAKRPNQVGLAHELIHADHITEGDVSFTPIHHTYQTKGGNVTQTKPNEELRTVGLKGVKKGDVTENQIRKEQGQNPRGAY